MPDEESISKEETFEDLTSIPSIGNLTARALIDADYDSVSKLKDADIEDLTSIDHIGEKLAGRIIQEIKAPSSDREGKENINFEFRCPICDKFTAIEKDKCWECEEPVKLFSSVVLPEKGIIEEPKKKLAEVEEKILENGGDVESWFIRGSILESMGANRKALESFDRVIELDPLFDYVWNAKAQVSLKIGETEEAAKAYKLAFDFRKAPKNIADEMEETETSTAEEIIELNEKEEIDKELDDRISKARKILRKLDDEKKDVSEITSKMDAVIEERIKGDKEKALDMVTGVIEECQSLSHMEDKKQDISDKIQKVDDLSKNLSDEIKNITGIKEAVSKAEKTLENENLEKASDLISDYLENESSLKYISNNFNEMKAMKNQIEDQDINEDFEKVKELCRDDDYQEAEDLLKEVMEQAEDSLEDVKRTKEDYLEEIEEIIERGERKGFDLEVVKEELDETKERFEVGEEDQERIIEQFERVKVKAENLLSLRANLTEIEKKISEYQELLNESKYEERIEKIENIFNKGNFENAIDTSRELKDEVETEIKNVKQKDELESRAKTKLADARKKLSELRETDFELEKPKELLKKSNTARKNGKFERSIGLAEKFIDSADKMIDLSKLIEKADEKIKKLDEKDLVDKERINYEIDQYKKLAKIQKYALAEDLLSETLEDLEEALDQEKMIPTPEEKLDESATEIPTQIKEKVRNVKELNNLVERADIKIKVNREPLKDAIIKIKDLDYREANKILMDWKHSLIDRLDYELEDRLDRINDEFEEAEITSLQRRGKAILENVERKWNMKAYEEALEVLIYASNFAQKIKEKETKKDKQIYVSSELIEDIKGLRNTNEVEELLSKAREKEEIESLEEIKKRIEDHLKDATDEEFEGLKDRLEGLSRKKLVVAISNLIDVKSSLDEGNLEKASWYMREFKDIIEEKG